MINLELLQFVPDDKKKEVEATLRASTTAVDTLIKVLTQRSKAIERQEASSLDYESPAWPFKQANRNGRYSAYQELIALFTFKKD
ncbi:hypothetical protein SAMN05444169_7613 [Bradyrhizobium erythrophlei]|uniref:Uncharacterized protein n=1 Tax=Bradyrhizobium erythrophlei TaxID=1437360 RepID=A0A1M5T8D7_9BRAD|nr:hypothetical protein SAMN05444169_7613 [Bradyrhizobium erythrophlei]